MERWAAETQITHSEKIKRLIIVLIPGNLLVTALAYGDGQRFVNGLL